MRVLVACAGLRKAWGRAEFPVRRVPHRSIPQPAFLPRDAHDSPGSLCGKRSRFNVRKRKRRKRKRRQQRPRQPRSRLRQPQRHLAARPKEHQCTARLHRRTAREFPLRQGIKGVQRRRCRARWASSAQQRWWGSSRRRKQRRESQRMARARWPAPASAGCPVAPFPPPFLKAP